MHCKSYSHFFSKKFQHLCVSLDVNFNESLTNDVVSFEQLGPDCAALLADLNLYFWYLLQDITSHGKARFLSITRHFSLSMLQASMAQLDVRLTGDQEIADSTPPGRQHSFVEIDREIFSTVILSLPDSRFKKGSCQFLVKDCA